MEREKGNGKDRTGKERKGGAGCALSRWVLLDGR